MPVSWSLLVFLLAVPISQSSGRDKVIAPDLSKIAGGNGWDVRNATADAVVVDGKSAVRLKANADSATGIAGVALADGVEFTTGVIEIDLKGKSVRPSFLGVVFNATDDKTFEAVYFRPFNFNAGGEFRGRAVQYIAWPQHTWGELRANRPRTFEGPIGSVPDPDKWFHARVEIEAKRVRVYVNDAKEPCLTVDRLAEDGRRRAPGLFVDSGDGFYASLKITPNLTAPQRPPNRLERSN